MKKILILIIALLMILTLALPCFADTQTDTAKNYVIDSFTGDVISTTDSGSSNELANEIKITGDISYRKSDSVFIYYTGVSSSEYIAISVYDGEYTTDSVTVNCKGYDKVKVYKDGELLEETALTELTEPGGYILRLSDTDEIVCSFNIMGEYCGSIFRIDLADIYKLSSVKIDGVTQKVTNLNSLSLSKEGEYDVNIINTCDVSYRYLHFYIDHTAPELEIIGVTDGEAHNAVSFGERESGSTLRITKDGEEIEEETEYEDAGDYIVEYTDRAGNTSVYSFKIYMYLDMNSWFVVGIVAAVIIAALVYILYKRRHLRVA